MTTFIHWRDGSVRPRSNLHSLKPNVKAAEFDETQHPRDDHGRFTDSGGGDSTSSKSISERALRTRVADAARKNGIEPPTLENVSQIDGRGRADLANVYEKMASRFPSATGTLEKISVQDGYLENDDGIQARTGLDVHMENGDPHFQQVIELPQGLWGQDGYDKLQEDTALTYGLGGNNVSRTDEILWHEMGHVLANNELIKQTDVFSYRMSPDEVGAAHNELSFNQAMIDNRFGPAGIFPYAATLSGYSTSQPHEAVAEAFVQRLRDDGVIEQPSSERTDSTTRQIMQMRRSGIDQVFNGATDADKVDAIDKSKGFVNDILDEMMTEGYVRGKGDAARAVADRLDRELTESGR